MSVVCCKVTSQYREVHQCARLVLLVSCQYVLRPATRRVQSLGRWWTRSALCKVLSHVCHSQHGQENPVLCNHQIACSTSVSFSMLTRIISRLLRVVEWAWVIRCVSKLMWHTVCRNVMFGIVHVIEVLLGYYWDGWPFTGIPSYYLQ